MDWIYGWGEYTQFLSQKYKIIKRRLQHIILFPLFFVAKRGETKNIWVFGVLITLGPEPPSPLNWANVYNCMFPICFHIILFIWNWIFHVWNGFYIWSNFKIYSFCQGVLTTHSTPPQVYMEHQKPCIFWIPSLTWFHVWLSGQYVIFIALVWKIYHTFNNSTF